MADPRLQVWAETLVGYCVGVEAGQTVAVLGGAAAESLLGAIYREVLIKGGQPVLLPSFSGTNADLFRHASDEQLQYISPLERFARTEADVVINVRAETNTKSLSSVDPARQLIHSRARAEIFETYMKRAATGDLHWTLTLYPTDAYAQDAEMATEEFFDFVLNACKLNRPDPAQAWRDLRQEQQRLIDWLTDKHEVHLTGPGTDLNVSVAGRTWINSDGKRNFPSGEIFTGPVENSAEGHVQFSFPVVTAGREIENIRLRFEAGKVIDAHADKNEEYLIRALDADPGARYLGEFAFGTNFDITRFIKNILFDEKIGGTVHMALGAGYPETGNHNHSAIHWDMICDLRQGGSADVDGQPFLRDGTFLV